MNHRIAFALLVSAFLAASGAASTSAASTQTSSGSSGSSSAKTLVHLRVRNASDHEICYLYISPVSDTHWGPDLLGSRTLSPGETDDYQMTPGHWDLKAEDCSHAELFVMHGATIDNHSVLTLHN